MAESPRRVDLRLTISTESPYRAVASELAAKFAEYVGAKPPAAGELARTVSASVNGMASAAPGALIAIDMSASDGELVVTTQSGTTTNRATCAIPD